jgi:peptidoglycan hydrolase-like protein with peptidoglycan-binding domain
MTAIKQDIKYLTSKVGPVDAATLAKAVEIIKAANAVGRKVRFVWGYDPNTGNTEHHSGHALDLMVYNKSDGEWLRSYIWTNRARLRLRHVIWNRSITSTVTSPGVRRKMADRGNPTENHEDHNHVLFLDAKKYVAPGTQAASPLPSVGVKPAARPAAAKAPRFPLPRGWFFGPKDGPKSSVSGYYGYRASLILWERQMKRRGWTITVNGLYDSQTKAVAAAFQKEKHLQQDGGRIGPETWAAAWTKPVT